MRAFLRVRGRALLTRRTVLPAVAVAVTIPVSVSVLAFAGSAAASIAPVPAMARSVRTFLAPAVRDVRVVELAGAGGLQGLLLRQSAAHRLALARVVE